MKLSYCLRGKDRDEDQDRLGVSNPLNDLVLVERLILDACLVASDSLDSDESLTVAQKVSAGR